MNAEERQTLESEGRRLAATLLNAGYKKAEVRDMCERVFDEKTYPPTATAMREKAVYVHFELGEQWDASCLRLAGAYERLEK